MITEQIIYFSGLGAALGFVHTFLGPDHYIPFVFMAKARKWSQKKTIIVTVVCGIGHVLSSVALGFAGIALGLGVSRLTNLEAIRGNWAAWAFTLFGFVYMLWGILRAYKKKPHKHLHIHDGGIVHEHTHNHPGEKVHKSEHSHSHEGKSKNLTPWVLFVIFVLGPCEPLIPVIIYPAIEERGSVAEAIIVSVVFAIVTLITMVTMVLILQKGLNLVHLNKLERYTHAIAGAMLLLSGIGILFLGL
jgi:ABC-type nickel/cobalt efflux system permease component RcnA